MNWKVIRTLSVYPILGTVYYACILPRSVGDGSELEVPHGADQSASTKQIAGSVDPASRHNLAISAIRSGASGALGGRGFQIARVTTEDDLLFPRPL